MKDNGNPTPEYINNLPIRQISIGGIVQPVRYDDEKKRIYLLDEEGNHTGSIGTADLSGSSQKQENKEMPESVMPAFAPAEAEGSPEVTDPPVPGDTEIPPPNMDEYEECTGRSWKQLLLVFGAAAAFIVIILLLSSLFSGKNRNTGAVGDTTASPTISQTEQTTVPIETTEATEQTEAPTEPEVKISVLVAGTTLLPGDSLDAADLTFMEISEEEYTMLSAMGGVYILGEEPILDGFVSNQYIPEGGYIWQDCAALTYSPANPWAGLENGYQTVRIPVVLQPQQLNSILCGTQVDIKIETQTRLTTDNPVSPEGDTADASGLQHDSSTVESMVIDTYIIPKALIVDTLNKRTDSVYADYCALATIPAPYRSVYLQKKYASVADLEELLPVYILIALPQQQAEFLNTLNTSNMTVTITGNAPKVDTMVQSERYEAVKETAASIQDAWKKLAAAESGA